MKGRNMYSKTLVAGWGDMDFNAHMGAAAYLVKCVDVRMMFFAENGYPMGEFARLRLGPVAMKDDLEYFSEVGLLDTIIVTMSLVGIQLKRLDGPRRAQAGGAPAALLGLLKKDMAMDDFVELPSSLSP
jgi:acyl-CoA thioesterase FadM